MLQIMAGALIGLTLMAAPKYQLRDLHVEIYNLQKRLQDLGYYNLKATGILGTLTQNALLTMQQNNGLTVDYNLTQEVLDAVYQNNIKGILTQNARYAKNGMTLEKSADGLLDRLPDQFKVIEPLTQNEYTFTVTEKKGCIIGRLNANKDFDLHVKKAIIAVINDKNYPASLEVTKTQIHVYLQGCKTPDGKDDALHNYNISRLLSLS